MKVDHALTPYTKLTQNVCKTSNHKTNRKKKKNVSSNTIRLIIIFFLDMRPQAKETKQNIQVRLHQTKNVQRKPSTK